MAFSLTFLNIFFYGIYLVLPLLLLMISLITILGQVVGHLEQWSKFNAFYWAFITALTVGYGDIRPTRRRSKIISLAIALMGIMMTGIVVAITVKAASVAFNEHIAPKISIELDHKNN